MTRLFLSACLVAGLVGCGSAAVPQERLTSAQAAIKGAEVAGAAEDPRASLHLKLAREQVARAQSLIADDENDEAASLIERAHVDAELAILLAQEARSRQEAANVKEQIEEIKRRMSQ